MLCIFSPHKALPLGGDRTLPSTSVTWRPCGFWKRQRMTKMLRSSQTRRKCYDAVMTTVKQLGDPVWSWCGVKILSPPPPDSRKNSFFPSCESWNALSAYQLQRCSATQGPTATSFNIAILLKDTLKGNRDGRHPGQPGCLEKPSCMTTAPSTSLSPHLSPSSDY